MNTISDQQSAISNQRRHHYPATRRAPRAYVQTRNKANLTGVVGITLTTNRGRLVYSVSPDRRKFNITRLGRAEAWRQAVAHRAAHERSVQQRGTGVPPVSGKAAQ